MGVDTNGYVGSNVTAKEIYDVVLQEISKDADFGVDSRNTLDSLYGFIDFIDGKDQRNLFIVENTEADSYQKDKMFNDNRYTYLSLGKWGNSIELMTKIVSKFGGYIDEDDCDSIEAFETYIPCDENFKLNEFVQKRNQIVGLIDGNVSLSEKIKLSHIILSNSEKLKEIL